MKKVTSWGRVVVEPHDYIPLADRLSLITKLSGGKSGIPYGMGRSYGDQCLNPNGVLWGMRGLDKFISFDAQTGLLVCEAGVLLRDIQQLFVPRGWSLPVTPGTLWITAGGAIANDVHGKNHHRYGTFGEHVQWLQLVRTNGEVLTCSLNENPDWFAATVGGMGLTGVISEVALQLRPIDGPWLETETVPFERIENFFELTKLSEADWEYTVAWFDCLSEGRGVLMRANHTSHQQPIPKTRSKTVPITLPMSFVNRLTLKPLNSLYLYLQQRKTGRRYVPQDMFLYPLDHVLEWNRLYGPRGFYQYQAVFDVASSCDAVKVILSEIKRAHQGSCMAVLKTFTERQSIGMMSFVKPGSTLALDFPNQGMVTLKLLTRLDAITQAAGGRVYLAKDGRLSEEMFEQGYPQLNQFLAYRDPGISSAMSRRLMGW